MELCSVTVGKQHLASFIGDAATEAMNDVVS